MRRTRFMINATCFERVQLRSFSTKAHLIRLEIAFDADFKDLFEVRGTPRAKHGRIEPAELTDSSVTLAYTGLDDKRRQTRLRFSPTPTTLDGGQAVFDVTLAPGEQALLYIEIACGDGALPVRDVRETYLVSMVETRRWMRTRSAKAAAMESSNELFNEAIRRAISDLYMLITEKPTGLYPYAGIPWFTAAFGRDALITALEALWIDPAIARGVLSFLAENQATTVDAASDAEPGKILHEVRNGEMAALGEVPFRRYYGSVDSTPLFIMLAGAYVARTHDETTAYRLWPHIEAGMEWIERYGDRDGDGFVEYFRATGQGLQNQGWKDSWDSVFHADGSLAQGPIALCEVQGYVYAARLAMATIGRRLGHDEIAAAQEKKAEALRLAFEAAYWCEEIGTYALALDGQKRPCRVRSSNAGHLLLAGIVSPDRARRLADGFMSNAFFSGWGIRTIASGEARFNPMGYHNGSVWPHDNALIALGLARYGHTEAVSEDLQRAVRRGALHRHAAAAGAVLRLRPPAGARTDLLSGGLLAAGLGGGGAAGAAAGLARAQHRPDEQQRRLQQAVATVLHGRDDAPQHQPGVRPHQRLHPTDRPRGGGQRDRTATATCMSSCGASLPRRGASKVHYKYGSS